jgi:hypothetical protein
LQAEDLVGLTDIGSLADLYDNRMFSISPNGGSIAVGVRRAVASHNSYCTGVYVVDRTGFARLVDSSEGTIFWKFPVVLGKANFPTGFPKVITPRWTSDGRAVAFLKPVDGIAQVWMVDANGSNGRPLTHSSREVEDFRLIGNSGSVVVKTSDQAQAIVARQREALSGYHFDDRFSPVAGGRPFLRGPLESSIAVWDVETGSERSPTAAEVSLFDDKGTGGTGNAWSGTAVVDEKGVSHLVARRSGSEIHCRSPLCTRIVGLPWSAGRDHIRYLRRKGWGESETAVYDWRVGAGAPREIYTTQDQLLDCADAAGSFICARETSARPRHLVKISPRTSSAETLFDPNPQMAGLSLGRVQRLHWRNAEGIACFGDLVFPTDFQKGARYPLIVVQYTTRGFLRGGTGDEYPIQLFANQGYLVLSVQRPASPLAGQENLPSNARLRAEMEGFRERRSILSAIEMKVQQLVADGMVDPERIGITGLSDGASTVQFALVNSTLFKAASVSSCCWERSQAWTLGPTIQAYYREIGWPALLDAREDFWRQISLSDAAGRIDIPLLIQPSDDEYLAALESVTALREASRPVDLYVFPDEHHVKRQPAHRLAIYQRNLDWFNFWLRGQPPSLAPDHLEEAERWTAMCRTRTASRALPCAARPH